MYDAKQQAQSEYFWDINTNNDQDEIFKVVRVIKDIIKDVTGEKCVRDDKGNLTISNEAKLCAWNKHYQRLLNVEFPWDKNSLNNSAAAEKIWWQMPSTRWNKEKQEDQQEWQLKWSN